MTDQLPVIIRKTHFNVPIYSYSKNDYDEHNIKMFSHLAKLPYVEDPIIFLPDNHQKTLLETPSSSVIVTHRRFSLSLTSPSQNCGMSFVLTSLFKSNKSFELLEKIIFTIKSNILLKYQAPVISRDDTVMALKGGAKWAIKKYNLPVETHSHIECNGNLPADIEPSPLEIKNSVPDEIIEISRQRFNIIGGGNHFFEFQFVGEILDERIARIWGLKRDQIVIMFHTGSEALGAYLGRLYASRRKTSLRQHLYFFHRKIKHHLVRGPWYSLPQRLSYYFVPYFFRFIDPDTEEGRRALLAVNCAANFGFANRLAILSSIQDSFRDVMGYNQFKIDLLYDCSHNSIYREKLNDDFAWVHRHNACRVNPPSLLKTHPFFSETGQPVILPGTNQTSSFLCAGREGAAATYYTVDHGLGAVQKHHEKSGGAKKTGEYSNLYSYDKDTLVKTPMLDDTAIIQAVESLATADIIRPVARLKPIATLKGPKSSIL